jgi:hypothetical protein
LPLPRHTGQRNAARATVVPTGRDVVRSRRGAKEVGRLAGRRRRRLNSQLVSEERLDRGHGWDAGHGAGPVRSMVVGRCCATGRGRIGVTDQEFAALVAERSARIPGVVAVTLGGSRAQGDHGPDSDWDFGLYYRGRLDPEDVAALGWPGRVFAPGEWGGGVIIGGAWLQVDGRQVDLHYRDLDDVEHWLAEARLRRFKVERLPFYLAGIPTDVVVGELAVAQVLVGELPRPEFPAALRHAASSFWQAAAELSLDYADSVYAGRGDALAAPGRWRGPSSRPPMPAWPPRVPGR